MEMGVKDADLLRRVFFCRGSYGGLSMATGCGLVGCSPMSLDIFLTNHGVTLVKHTVLQQSINGRWGEHADLRNNI